MGANVGWSFGTSREYEAIARGLTDARKEDLVAFADAIRAGKSLAEAHQIAFSSVLGSVYRRVTENWFGERPMWFANSELTPGQIHEVIRESRARLAELLLAGAKSVRIYIGCGHARARTLITWDGACAADARLTPDGARWMPAAAQGQDVTMWVMVPFNTGYRRPDDYGQPTGMPAAAAARSTAADPTEQVEALARQLLSRHIGSVTDRLRSAGVVVDPDGTVPAQHEPLRRVLLNTIPVSDLLYITRWLPRDEAVFRGTVLGLRGDGIPQPGRQGLRVVFDRAVLTPPVLPPGVPADMAAVRGVPLPPRRVGPGIMITWM